MTDKEKLEKIQRLLNMPMFKDMCLTNPRLAQWAAGVKIVLNPPKEIKFNIPHPYNLAS